MTFDLVWTFEAKERLAALPRDIQYRVVKKLVACRADPFRYAVRLVGRPGWRIRIGDHRAIVMIDRAEQTLTVVTVGHRSQIYK